MKALGWTLIGVGTVLAVGLLVLAWAMAFGGLTPTNERAFGGAVTLTAFVIVPSVIAGVAIVREP